MGRKRSSLRGFFGYLMLVSEASGAQIEPLHLTIYHNGNRVNVRSKVTVGMTFGVADVMAELAGFTAQITFSRQYPSPLTRKLF